MDATFDIYTLIFLVLAVVIFLRLRSVLGRRTGNERPPPFDPYTRGEGRDKPAPGAPGGQDKVIALPQRNTGAPQREPVSATVSAEQRIRDFMPTDTPTGKGLIEIAGADASFEPRQFINGAKSAYEMIVTAFAGGDRKQLKNLLAREVYDGFASAIGDREGRGDTVETRFVGISKADIIDAELKNKTAHVTVKFVSELITAIRNKAGEVIEGDPKKIREVVDIWTFAREVSSRDPNWKLVATQAAN